MLDPKLLRGDLDATAQQLARRGFELDKAALQARESRRRELQTQTEQLQNERNTRSKSIGKAKANGEDIQPLLDEVSDLGERLDAAKRELAEVQAEWDDAISGIPNLPHESVPEGKSEDDNVEPGHYVVQAWIFLRLQKSDKQEKFKRVGGMRGCGRSRGHSCSDVAFAVVYCSVGFIFRVHGEHFWQCLLARVGSLICSRPHITVAGHSPPPRTNIP